MPYKFDRLGEGTYNTVYKYVKNGFPFVFKVQKQSLPEPNPEGFIGAVEIEQAAIHNSLDIIDRSIQIWNEINPSLKAEKKRYIINRQVKDGWVVPYIEGKQATDSEIKEALILLTLAIEILKQQL